MSDKIFFTVAFLMFISDMYIMLYEQIKLLNYSLKYDQVTGKLLKQSLTKCTLIGFCIGVSCLLFIARFFI